MLRRHYIAEAIDAKRKSEKGASEKGARLDFPRRCPKHGEQDGKN